MALWRQITRGLRALVNRTAADRKVADEVEHYLHEATAAFQAEGLSPEEAQRAARRHVGHLPAVVEEVRDAGWETIVERLAIDVRYSVRRLLNSPGFAVVCVCTLGLGIGAVTAIFSAVKPILLDPLPYPHADRIVTIWDVGTERSRADVTFGTYRETAERSRSFDSLAVMKPWLPTLTGIAQPERLDGQRVSAGYFRVLGVAPALGGDFRQSDDRPGGSNVAMLSDGLWRRRFGGDRAIIGRQIRLNDDPYTVIGVMPGRFENILAPSTEAWALLQYDPSLPPEGREWGHHLRLVGRLLPGTDLDSARRDLEAIARSRVEAFTRPAWAALDYGFIVTSMHDEMTRDTRPTLLAVAAAVLLLLAIAAVNVASLLLARSAERRGELAMRAALGASRTRLVQQLLTDSLVIALLGGAAGVAVAGAGIRALVALSPDGLPRADAIALDWPVLAFAFAVSTAIGFAIGTIPAAHVVRDDIHARVEQMSRRTVPGRRRARGALVIAQVALALVLLVTAGLLLRSVQRILAIDPGFSPEALLTMQVQTSGRRFDDDAVTNRFFADALAAVRAVPGVSAAAFTSQLPLTGDLDTYGVQLESAPAVRPDDDHSAFRYAVSPGYFEAMRIPLRRGRLLDERDTDRAAPAVVIGASLARRRFAGRDPIGQRVHVGPTDRPWYTVVGIVGDVRQTSLAVSQADGVYVTNAQWPFADMARWLAVRAKGDAAALAPTVRQAIWQVDKDRPIVRVATMDGLVARSEAQRRFTMILFETFGLTALVLAATGLYGLLAGSVTERTREIGVRAALGASRLDILALVVRQGMMLTAAGAAAGLIASALVSRGIVTLLYDVSPLDPLTYAAVAALLFAVAAFASAIPAARAAWIDPSVTLRSE